MPACKNRWQNSDSNTRS